MTCFVLDRRVPGRRCLVWAGEKAFSRSWSSTRLALFCLAIFQELKILLCWSCIWLLGQLEETLMLGTSVRYSWAWTVFSANWRMSVGSARMLCYARVFV